MRLGGRYEILEELRGHQQVRVFRAMDTAEHHDVIIKTMPATSEGIEDFVRFQEEGAVITSLEHPNIWKVYGTFIDAGVSCIVLESVAGRTLSEVLRVERLPLWRVKSFALQIASALAYAHARRVIHRDLEPENIVITPADTVKVRAIAELGMARIVRGAAIPAQVGNPRSSLYASPEQRAGHTVGPQTDIYSLGALMYHMVNGHPPFDDALYPGGMPFREDVPVEWQSVIAQSMARSERYRIKSAVELGTAIERLPSPGGQPMHFEVPHGPARCRRCGREGSGRFCAACGAPLDV